MRLGRCLTQMIIFQSQDHFSTILLVDIVGLRECVCAYNSNAQSSFFNHWLFLVSLVWIFVRVFALFSSNCLYLSKCVFSTWNSIRFIWNIKWANQSTNQEKQTTQTNNKSLIAILSGFPLNITLNSLCCLRLLWNEKGNDKIGRAALVSFASKYHVNQTSYIYVASVDRPYTYKSIKNSCIFLTRFFSFFPAELILSVLQVLIYELLDGFHIFTLQHYSQPRNSNGMNIYYNINVCLHKMYRIDKSTLAMWYFYFKEKSSDSSIHWFIHT